MPKQTFFNLPEKKRHIIEQAALDEFSEYGLDGSNMNRIVEQGQISKGSFYQYFEDKKDLYLHLVDRLAHQKIEALQPVLQTYRDHSFADNLAALFRIGLQFSDGDRRLARLGQDFSKAHRRLAVEFSEQYTPVGVDIYTDLLRHARETGELYEDIDIPLAAGFLSGLINETTFYLLSLPYMKEQREQTIQELLKFIERAVLKPQKEVAP